MFRKCMVTKILHKFWPLIYTVTTFSDIGMELRMVQDVPWKVDSIMEPEGSYRVHKIWLSNRISFKRNGDEKTEWLMSS